MPKHQTSLEKIERKKDDAVFLVCEFTKLGGEDQALRALRTPPGKGRLVRLGHAPWPCQSLEADAGGFTGAAHQALDERGVEGEPTEAESAL
ncbi:hypothetical protein ACVWZL_008806 [Bradyrhizobium sp. GM2.4]